MSTCLTRVFEALQQDNVVVLNVDVLLSAQWDLGMAKGVYRALLWAAMRGKISTILGGRTFTRLRTISRKGGKDIRGPRTATSAYLMEHPQDPNKYVRDTSKDHVSDLPSLWSTDMWRSFKEMYDMRKITVDQGVLGHRARKPTSLGTNLALDHLHGKRDSRRLATPVKDLSGPELAAWAEGLKVEIEKIVMDSIYFLKPLKTKTSKEVFEKVKEVYVELRNENLPVTRVHGDRAHEFFSAPLRSWALDRDVEVTRTEGQSPQSNGTAESSVRDLKNRVKLLLGASKLPMKMWPSAFTTAAHQQRSRS